MEAIQSVTRIKSSLKDYTVSAVSTEEQLLAYIKSKNPSLIFMDATVYDLYPSLSALDKVISIQAIEQNKSYAYTEVILDEFVNHNLKKNSTVVVIGGGIIQDAVGYCCSVYTRGISYFLIPTTLLAQCDSCIGGKTSINYKDRKNLIGTFYPPAEIVLYPNFVHTLTKEDFRSGLGEIFKFYCLQNLVLDFKNKLGLFLERRDIDQLVISSIAYKGHIIQIDEFDEKERKFLNFGHTFGHALESSSHFAIPHGSGVVIGCWIAFHIAFYLNKIDKNQLMELREICISLVDHLNLKAEWFEYNLLLQYIKSDKKNTGSIIMVLPQKTEYQLEVLSEDTLEKAYQFALQEIKKDLKINE